MSNGLEMQTGPRFLKPAILAAVAVAFGVTAYAMTSSKDDAKAPVTAATDQTAMAAAADTTSSAPADNTMNTETAAAGSQQMSQPAASASSGIDPAAGSAAASMSSQPSAGNASSQTAAVAPAEEPAVAAVASSPTAMAKEPAKKEVGEMESASTEPTAADMAMSAPADDKQKVAVASPARHQKAKLLAPAKPPAAEALRAWWQTPESPQRLGVEYVGQAADQKTLVIRFDQQVTDPAAMQNIKLLSDKGETVAATWQAGDDPRVLVAPNLQPGRYTVLMGPELASVQGQSLGTQLHGPAFIQ